MVSRDEFFQKARPEIHAVNVDGFGKLHIREVMAGEGVRFAKRMEAAGDDAEAAAKVMAEMVASCVVDESGNSIFEDGDVEKLLEMSSKRLTAVAQAVMRVSGMGQEENPTS